MRRTASEKMEIIRLVEGTDLPVRATLRQMGVPRSTFYGLDSAVRRVRVRRSSRQDTGSAASLEQDPAGGKR